MAETLLDLKRVSVSYPGSRKVKALNSLSLTLYRGEVLGLIGSNGAGKTTAIKAALGFLPVTKGIVSYRGSPLNESMVHRYIRYLPEKFVPHPHLTGREFLHFMSKMDQAGSKQVDQVLTQVGLGTAADRRLRGYSKGMMQRIGLAQAILGNPECIILDEPTTGLDPIGRNDVKRLMLALKNKGTSLLLCTHVLAEVQAVCDRLAVLVQGQLQYLGSVAEFLKKHNTSDLESAFIWENQGIANGSNPNC
ncbi:MAG: ABC transporter ATP-binding protein [Gammaproteobacteria bacterium]|nr:ABC transporter ATP-binding protein [Gammaproteobacteria bacterium]